MIGPSSFPTNGRTGPEFHQKSKNIFLGVGVSFQPTMPDQRTPLAPIHEVDEKVEFARIMDEAELQQIKLNNERSKTAMNGIIPSWYNTPTKAENNTAVMINEPLKEKSALPVCETPER